MFSAVPSSVRRASASARSAAASASANRPASSRRAPVMRWWCQRAIGHPEPLRRASARWPSSASTRSTSPSWSAGVDPPQPTPQLGVGGAALARELDHAAGRARPLGDPFDVADRLLARPQRVDERGGRAAAFGQPQGLRAGRVDRRPADGLPLGERPLRQHPGPPGEVVFGEGRQRRVAQQHQVGVERPTHPTDGQRGAHQLLRGGARGRHPTAAPHRGLRPFPRRTRRPRRRAPGRRGWPASTPGRCRAGVEQLDDAVEREHTCPPGPRRGRHAATAAAQDAGSVAARSRCVTGSPGRSPASIAAASSACHGTRRSAGTCAYTASRSRACARLVAGCLGGGAGQQTRRRPRSPAPPPRPRPRVRPAGPDVPGPQPVPVTAAISTARRAAGSRRASRSAVRSTRRSGAAERPRGRRAGAGSARAVGVEQVLQQRRHQQRQPRRRSGAAPGAHDGCDAGGQQRGNGGVVPRPQREQLGGGAPAQVRDRGAERGAFLGVAVGRHDEEARPVRGQRQQP